jgi:DNA-binding MarR family transcriptional regulator
MTDNQDTLPTLFRFFNELHIVAQLSGNAFERVMPQGMTLPQFAVLNHLARLGGNRTPLDITMTNTLGHLEKAGYVAIRPDEKDGRSKRVDITPAGHEARRACVAAVGPEMAALAQAVSPGDLETALPLLERVRIHFDQRR